MMKVARRLGNTLSNSNSLCATDERLRTTGSAQQVPKQSQIGLTWFKASGMRAHSILGSAQLLWLHLLSEYRYAGLFLIYDNPSCCFMRKWGSQAHHHLDTLWRQQKVLPQVDKSIVLTGQVSVPNSQCLVLQLGHGMLNIPP